ncbi:gliding motility-associated C-terminal domain-containing protein [Hymenobacter algoricola]|uniref:T9SS type B sorting domain-containing protein n=1 Tax=Hymenobacter algoricola TaxID=486267 RepID=UPI0031EA78CF
MNSKLLLLLALLLGGLTAGYGQSCPDNSNGTRNFRVYDAATKQEVNALCVGIRYRLKDVSDKLTPPQIFPASRIYYLKGPVISCAAGTDTTTFYTPTAAGPLVITQNTPNLVNPATGIIYSRTFEVRERPAPVFTLTSCSPGLVEVRINDQSLAYTSYFVQVGAATATVPRGAAPTQYPVGSGVTSVTVTGQYTGGCSSAPVAQSFTPAATPVAPFIRQLNAQAGQLEFQFAPLQAGYRYSLQQAEATAPGGYRTLAAITQPTHILTPAPAAGCFRLLLTDVCQTSVVSLPSAELCAIALTGTSANGRNLLSWPTTGNFAGYVLRRDGVVLPGAASPYTDSVGITCGISYRYRLEATAGAGISTSEVTVLTSALRVQPVPRLFATFNARNQVELTATVPNLPSGGQLLYLRDNTQTVATTARRTARDSTAAAGKGASCYTVQFLDECGNKSAPSEPFCPVFLTARAADAEGTRAQLNWTALGSQAPAAAVRYAVEVQLADGSWRALNAALAAFEFVDLQPPADRQVLRYRVAASSPGQLVSYSNVATVARQLRLFMPNAFSPNGDGLNDVFGVKGRFVTKFTFTIVDRNGQEVFRGTDPTQTWNGRIGTAEPAPGAYVWRFEATDDAGTRIVQHGTVTIVR